MKTFRLAQCPDCEGRGVHTGDHVGQILTCSTCDGTGAIEIEDNDDAEPLRS